MRRVLLSLTLFTIVILFFAMIFGFSKNFYLKEFSIYHPEKELQINAKFVRYAGEIIPEYLMGRSTSLSIPGFKNFFNSREIRHMEDVKRIFFWVKLISAGLVILFLFLIKKGDLFKVFLYSSFFLVIFFLIFLIFPFDRLFTAFHKVLFSNNLWLLNPETDRLIVLLPEKFFIDAAKGIILSSLFALISLSIIFKLTEGINEKIPI